MTWTAGSGDSRDSALVVSFVAGVASASLLWWAYHHKKERHNRQWMETSVKSHIGELPESTLGRTRWPWDTLRRTVSSWAVDEEVKREILGEEDQRHQAENPQANNNVPFPHSSRESFEEEKKNSDLCIGSIFGLDVGGTLAKLVYFEQQNNVLDQQNNTSFRELHYHQAASATAVLEARRGRCSSVVEEDLFPVRERRKSSCVAERRATVAAVAERRSSTMTSLHSMLQEHTKDSNEDLKQLYMMRQESVPDNLDKYAESCNITKTNVSSNLSVRNVVLGKQEDKQNEQDFYVGEQPQEPPATAPSSPQTSSTTEPSMRRSRSMFDLSKSRDHAEALDRFYNFARRLDTYETGVKDKHLSFYSRELGGDFHFIRFETRRMENAMDLIRVNNLHLNIREMGATGGGAHKFAAAWRRVLGIEMVKQDELDSLVAGMQFVLDTVVGECYTFRPNLHRHLKKQQHGFSDSETEEPTKRRQSSVSSSTSSSSPSICSGEADRDDKSRIDEWWWSRKVQRDVVMGSDAYPYLLVTIGTGVSILRVDGPRKHERISGSTIGGGTYWGLIRLLTDVDDFEDVMKLAEKGDPSKVDMMVGDIYGANSDALERMKLSPDVVASSFGKLVAKQDPASGIKQEDLARALLLMVTVNIGQVAYLNAQLHNTRRIYFVGNFLRHNQISQRRLSFAIDYWSKGVMEALFLEHEGYFGSLGAFLLSQGISHGDQGFFQWEGSSSAAASTSGIPTTQQQEEGPQMSQQHRPRSSAAVGGKPQADESHLHPF